MDPLLTGDEHPAVEPDGDVGFLFELIGEGGGDFGVLVEVAEEDVLGYCWQLWNVVAIHDHASGDGELFARYRCKPGKPVDFYEDGSKHNILFPEAGVSTG